MAIEYLEVQGITDAAKKFREKIEEYDECVTSMNNVTSDVLREWVGQGRNIFETQMNLMKGQLDDISDILYDIYDALLDAEEGYIDADVEIAKQISANMDS